MGNVKQARRVLLRQEALQAFAAVAENSLYFQLFAIFSVHEQGRLRGINGDTIACLLLWRRLLAQSR